MSFNARILDPDALREITPAALRSYIEDQGWHRVDSYGDFSDVYIFGKKEAIVPGTPTIADYARAVSEIITLVARIEERDELQVYRDILVSDRDVVRVRAPEADNDGSVRLETGVDLVVHARDLLLSAACSAFDARRAYRAGRIKEAFEYINQVRLGQTERGSFIVTLLSPVPPTLEPIEQSSLWPMPSEDPFERRVTRRLADGLEAAREAIDATNRGSGFLAFDGAVPRGLNANLCEATARLIELGGGIDVSVTWARTRPTPEPRRRTSFSSSDSQILKEAARLFRDKEPRPDERLEGFIVKLSRDEDEYDGRATLRAFIDERPASIRVDLPKHLYEEAVRAHKDSLAVTLKGDLAREGHRWKLMNPRDLTISIADDEAV